MKNWKEILVFCIIVLVAGWAMYAVAADGTPGLVRLEGKDPAAAKAAKAAHNGTPAHGQLTKLKHPIKLQDTAPRAAGTIVYDTGTVTAYSTSQFSSYGNRFNSALNGAGTAVSPVQLSGSVTFATWGVRSVDGAATWGTMWITLYDQLNTTAGTAPVVASTGFNWGSGPHTGPAVLAAGVGPWTYSGSSFLMGMFDYNTNATTPNNVAGLIDSAASVSGQGFHGYSMVWGSSTGTGYNAMTNANVIMRATGNVIVPVELMGFTVE